MEEKHVVQGVDLDIWSHFESLGIMNVFLNMIVG